MKPSADLSRSSRKAKTPKLRKLRDAHSVFQWLLSQFDVGEPREVPIQASGIPQILADDVRLYGCLRAKSYSWGGPLIAGFFHADGLIGEEGQLVQLPGEMALLCYELCVELEGKKRECKRRGIECAMSYEEIVRVMLSCHDYLSSICSFSEKSGSLKFRLDKKAGQKFGAHFNVKVPEPPTPVFLPLE